MTRLEEKRRFEIWEGQRLLSRAVRHVANRAACISQSGALFVPKGPDADACQLLNGRWKQLERQRRNIRRAMRKRRECAA